MQIERRTGVVRTLSYGRGSTDRIHAGNDIDRSCAEVRADGIQLPIAEYKVGRFAPVVEGREHVDHVAHERVTSIEIGVASIDGEVERIAR